MANFQDARDLISTVIYCNVPCYCYDSVGGTLLTTLTPGTKVGKVLSSTYEHKFLFPNVYWLAVDNADIKAIGAFYVTYQPDGFHTETGENVTIDAQSIKDQTSEHDITKGVKDAVTTAVDSVKAFWSGLEKTMKWVVIGVVAIAAIWLFSKLTKSSKNG